MTRRRRPASTRRPTNGSAPSRTAPLAVGITDFAQDALGDIVFVEFPKVGAKVKAGDAVGVVESVKAASDIYAPVSGEVVADQRRHPRPLGGDQPGRVRGVALQAAAVGRRRAEGAARRQGLRGDRGGRRNDCATGADGRRAARLRRAAHRPEPRRAAGDARRARVRVARRAGRAPRPRDDPRPRAARRSRRRRRGRRCSPRCGALAAKNTGAALVHRHGLSRHAHAGGDPAQRPREPGLVHGVHAVPARDLPGPPGGAAQLPDDDHRPHRARRRERVAPRRGHRGGGGDGALPARSGLGDGRRVLRGGRLPSADDRSGAARARRPLGIARRRRARRTTRSPATASACSSSTPARPARSSTTAS